jgi:predicted nuclease of restriction endonuclease-like (RecB) superfamily
MPDLMSIAESYTTWLGELKQRIQSAQQRAALSVNRELVLLYWHIGHDILERQKAQGWGAKIVDQLAKDLTTAFPDMKGFSRSNLMYMRAFHEAWPDESIVQQLVGQLPWGQNLLLLTKLKTIEERQWYAAKAIEHGWSRNVM